MNNNPLYSLFHFLKSVFLDHFILIILLVSAVLLVYIFRGLILSLTHKIEKIYHNVIDFLQNKKIKDTLERSDEAKKVIAKIKNDTIKNIEMLNSDKTKYTSMQYLYAFPSPAGFNALFKIAIEETDRKTRSELICHLCETAKNGKWYYSIK